MLTPVLDAIKLLAGTYSLQIPGPGENASAIGDLDLVFPALERGDAFTFNTSAGPLDCVGTPAGTAGFKELDADATDEDFDGLTVRVASIEDLMRMKRAARRPKEPHRPGVARGRPR